MSEVHTYKVDRVIVKKPDATIVFTEEDENGEILDSFGVTVALSLLKEYKDNLPVLRNWAEARILERIGRLKAIEAQNVENDTEEQVFIPIKDYEIEVTYTPG